MNYNTARALGGAMPHIAKMVGGRQGAYLEGQRGALENSLLMQKLTEGADATQLARDKHDLDLRKGDDAFAIAASRSGMTVPDLQLEHKRLSEGNIVPFTEAGYAENSRGFAPALQEALTLRSGFAGDRKTMAETPAVEARSNAEKTLIEQVMANPDLQQRLLGFAQSGGKATEPLYEGSVLRDARAVAAETPEMQTLLTQIMSAIRPQGESVITAAPGAKVINKGTGQVIDPGIMPQKTFDQWMVEQAEARTGGAPAAAPAKAPPGMKQVGTANGKPVYEDAQGRRFQ